VVKYVVKYVVQLLIRLAVGFVTLSLFTVGRLYVLSPNT
jgi:hypothetical protein